MTVNAKQAKVRFNSGKKIGLGQIILLLCVLLFTVFCAAPVLLVFISAFADEMYINQHGFSFFPQVWSMNGMDSVLRYGNQLVQSYLVTIFVTVTGTLLGLLIMSMYAYSISRHGFKLAKFLSIFLLIPMLFNGGQLAGYIVFTSWYGLKDNLLLAATIDGAGNYRTFFQITLPLLKPSLAAVGFMMATAYWNDWQNALLYITSNNKKPLQLLLINIQKSIEFLLNNNNVPAAARAAMGNTIPQYSSTMATVIVVIAPIMVIYPFFQKYFVKGLTVGSVKG